MNARGMKRLLLALPNDPVVLKASYSLFSENIHMRNVVLNVATGLTLTLPPAKGSGTNFTVLIGTAVSAASYIIKRAVSTDIIQGWVFVNVPATPASTAFQGGATSNTITLNASTTGGLGVGDWFDFIDILSGVWAVSGQTQGSGAVATPFSNT